jgi:predicted TPR repeat methyltransferase
MTPAYDDLAGRYDQHFTRPVDRWEDARLARLIGPHASGRRVLDLACGTGWVADHCDPGEYTGMDVSAGMLAACEAKHPDAMLFNVAVGGPGWTGYLGGPYDAVVCTWAAHYLGDLSRILSALEGHLMPRAAVILHGQAPRYEHRSHYIADGTGHRYFTPSAVRMAAEAAGWPYPGVTGCGALPDWAAAALPASIGRAAWNATLRAGPDWHYSVAYTWTSP